MIETNTSRLQWTFRIMLMAVLGTLLLSSKVWMTDRNFPVIPIFEGIPSMPSPLDYILYSVLIVLAIYQIIYLENRNTMYALIGMYAFLMAGDQMRWQPYNVQYLLIMIGLLFYPLKSDQRIAAAQHGLYSVDFPLVSGTTCRKIPISDGRICFRWRICFPLAFLVYRCWFVNPETQKYCSLRWCLYSAVFSLFV